MSRRAWRIMGLLVWTSMPSQAVVAQEARPWSKPSTATTQTRQLPSRLRSGW